MKRILYAGGSLVTGDAIADAVLEYAEGLAQRETSAVARIPVRGVDGVEVEAAILLGPSSQLIALPEEAAGGELLDAVSVQRLRNSIDRLVLPLPMASQVDDSAVLSEASQYTDPSSDL